MGRHAFSIELNSKDHLNRISVNNEPQEEVIFEGELGELEHIRLVEGVMLQISGENGVLRIDITDVELTQIYSACGRAHQTRRFPSS